MLSILIDRDMNGEDGVQVMNSKINNNPVPNKNTNQTKKVTSPYTEDWINVKAIKNGVILLPNREMVTGVKIMPKNIFILDFFLRKYLINSFARLLSKRLWRLCHSSSHFTF